MLYRNVLLFEIGFEAAERVGRNAQVTGDDLARQPLEHPGLLGEQPFEAVEAIGTLQIVNPLLRGDVGRLQDVAIDFVHGRLALHEVEKILAGDGQHRGVFQTLDVLHGRLARNEAGERRGEFFFEGEVAGVLDAGRVYRIQAQAACCHKVVELAHFALAQQPLVFLHVFFHKVLREGRQLFLARTGDFMKIRFECAVHGKAGRAAAIVLLRSSYRMMPQDSNAVAELFKVCGEGADPVWPRQ